MRARMLLGGLVAALVWVPGAHAAIGDLTYAGSSAAGAITMPVTLAFAGDTAYLAGGDGTNDGTLEFTRDPLLGTLGALGDDRGYYGPADLAVAGADLYVAGRSGGQNGGRVLHRRIGADGTLSDGGCWGSGGGCTPMTASMYDATAVAVAPDGANVYVADTGFGAPRVVEFARDAATGALTEGTCAGIASGCAAMPSDQRALTQPTDVVVSPDGKHVYVADPPAGGVSWWTRGAGGALTFGGCIVGDASDFSQAGCAVAPHLSSVPRIMMAPDGRDLYVPTGFDATLVQLRRDPATGALAEAGCDGAEDGCDPLPGALQSAQVLSNATSVAGSADGASVYVASRFADALVTFARDRDTGALSVASCDEPADDLGAACDGYTPQTTAARGARGAIAVSGDARTVAIGGYSGGGVASFVRATAACADSTATVAAGASVPVVLACTDVDGGAVAPVVVSGPATGTLSGGTYTAAAGYARTDTVTFRAPGPNGTSNVATLTVTVTGEPDPGPGPGPGPGTDPGTGTGTGAGGTAPGTAPGTGTASPPPGPGTGTPPGGAPARPPAAAPRLTLSAVRVTRRARRTVTIGARASRAGSIRVTVERRAGRRWVRVGRATTARVRSGANRLVVTTGTRRRGAYRVRLVPAGGTPVTARFSA